MKWIVILIVVFVVFELILFIKEFRKQRNSIAANGGIKNVYKVLVDGLLEYSSARIIQDKKDYLTVGGTFTDVIIDRECGVWSVIIQPTFNTLNVRYQAHIDLEGGEDAKESWNFPISMSQEEMLSIIKKKADAFNGYGCFK